MLIVPLLKRLKPMMEKAGTFKAEFPASRFTQGYCTAIEELLVILDDFTIELEIRKED